MAAPTTTVPVPADGSGLDVLAYAIAASGVTAHRSAVAELAGEARRIGVSPVLVAVLEDGDAPDVARQRAFGRVAQAVSASRRPEAVSARPVYPPRFAPQHVGHGRWVGRSEGRPVPVKT